VLVASLRKVGIASQFQADFLESQGFVLLDVSTAWTIWTWAALPAAQTAISPAYNSIVTPRRA
jgi:hypothetical protein